ncbi:MAG: DUF1858 domain-containing protein [Bacteroidales bacterium]
METKLIITPKTRVSEILETYPELEEALTEMTPVFKKLKNPMLRRTIARVTSLQQAAAVGEIPVETVVNKLRSLTGQDKLEGLTEASTNANDLPSWFDPKKIRKTFDAREIIAGGGHPLTDVLRDLHGWNGDDIYEFVTPFLPAPLLDKVRELGFNVWTKKENGNLYRNYFRKGN